MNDLSNADIVTKYRCAGDIANSVLTAIIEAIKPGVKAVELCKRGDDLVEEATSKVYNVKKGAVRGKDRANFLQLTDYPLIILFSAYSQRVRDGKQTASILF